MTRRPTVTQHSLLAPLRHFQATKRTHFTCKSCRPQCSPTCSLCPVEKTANTDDKMGLLHYPVPHVRLIVNIAIALTANKHNLIAHQLFDGRKTGNLEMILRWETSLLSFRMRFCFPSSLPSPSPQWLYFSTNSTSKYYSQYKIFQHSSESWGFHLLIPDICSSIFFLFSKYSISLNPFILITVTWAWGVGVLFANEETEAQNSKVTCPETDWQW